MQVDKLMQGAEFIKAKPSGGSKRFTPMIYWKENNESKLLAFVTPISEMFTVDVHTYETRQGWRTFVCRKNPAFYDESGGHCPLCELVDDDGKQKSKPSRRHLTIAAELDAVEERVGGRRQIAGVTVKQVEFTKDGETRKYPRFGLVMQSAHNFFNYLTAYDAQRQDITDLSWEVIRQGKGNTTSYSFIPVDQKVDLSEYDEFIPSIIDYIAEKGSLEYYEQELGEVEAVDTTELNSKFEELKARLEAPPKKKQSDAA